MGVSLGLPWRWEQRVSPPANSLWGLANAVAEGPALQPRVTGTFQAAARAAARSSCSGAKGGYLQPAAKPADPGFGSWQVG